MPKLPHDSHLDKQEVFQGTKIFQSPGPQNWKNQKDGLDPLLGFLPAK